MKAFIKVLASIDLDLYAILITPSHPFSFGSVSVLLLIGFILKPHIYSKISLLIVLITDSGSEYPCTIYHSLDKTIEFVVIAFCYIVNFSRQCLIPVLIDS